MAKRKAKGDLPRNTKCTLGPNAPTERLNFGKWGNYTAVELLAYLPKAIRSFDVARSFTRNGLGIQTMTNLINAFRMWDKHPALPHSIFKKVQAAMRDHPDYKDWKMRDTANDDLSDHDPTDLTLGGFVPQCVRFPANGWKVKPSVPFKLLAVDVQSFPEGDDALDLTGCERYAAEHPEEIWNYLDDFERLKMKLGGPEKVRPEHYDATVSHRWATWHLDSHEESEWKPADGDTDGDSDCSDEDTDVMLNEGHQDSISDGDAESAAHILSLGRRVLRSAQGSGGPQHLVSLAEPMPEAHRPALMYPTRKLEFMTGGSDEPWHLQSSLSF